MAVDDWARANAYCGIQVDVGNQRWVDRDV